MALRRRLSLLCALALVTVAVLVSSATVLQPDPKSLGMLFDNFAIGSPSQFRWTGELKAFSDAVAEPFPGGTAAHVEEGFLETCAPASSSRDGYVTETSNPTGVAAALRLAGAGDVRQHGYGLVTFATKDVPSALTAVYGVDAGARIEPNLRRTWSEVPNDPLYVEQWDLRAVRAEQAWDLTHGSPSVVVAVVDSGIDATHPQLAGKLVAGYDATTGAALAAGNTDDVGHGTAVAGLVAARASDGASIASLGWDTKVMPVKAGGADGPSTADTVEGLRWAVDRGARVVNLSLGSCNSSQLEQDAMTYAESRGVLVVAAAGNCGPGAAPDYPAAYASVLAVGATGFTGEVAPYSNRGSYVDLVAPGGSADGEEAHSVQVLQTGGGEAYSDGTSFASPIAAAAAALVLARNGGVLSPADVRTVLTTTAADRGAPGRDDVYGAGLLDAGRAVAETPVAPGPPPGQVPTLTAPTIATAGVVITVGGTAAPGAVVELWGVTAPNGTITRVNTPTVTADANGRWSKVIRPLRNVNLQARVGTAASATRFIAVKTAVRQSVSPLAGCVVQVSGAVFEPKPGATVYIRALDAAGRTVSLGTGFVEGDGRFLLRKPWACGQVLSVYTVISGDNVNRPGGTGVQRITTRR